MPHARLTDPNTSHSAASSVQNITETQQAILQLLTLHPMTDQELVRWYQNQLIAPRASESGIRSRRAELVEQGLVKDTGERKKLESGRSAVVWTAA